MDPHELAWAAGFFDGEGWAGATLMGRGSMTRAQARINQADPSGVPAVLLRFRDALGGLGQVGGPYEKDGRVDLYRWSVSSQRDVELLHHLLVPWLGQVKLAEFAETLGRPAVRSRAVTKRDDWVAWCAGFFDGEGWASMWPHRSHLGYLSAEVGVGQSSAAGTPEVLLRFQEIVGCGRIYGPYAQEGATMGVYKFKASALDEIYRVMDAIHSRLSPVKRSDVTLVREILDGQPQLPRGNPAWGNRKTHCVNGHAYANTRVRPYVSRGKGHERRDSEQCLQCAREQARARRAKKKSSADDGGRSISEPAPSYLLK